MIDQNCTAYVIRTLNITYGTSQCATTSFVWSYYPSPVMLLISNVGRFRISLLVFNFKSRFNNDIGFE